MSSYKSRTSNCIGGIFIAGDGSYLLIPDQWLHDAKLLKDSALLRLCYSSCVVEISGYRLDKIFDDATAGKLGTLKAQISAADKKALNATNSPFITGIIHAPMSPVAASDLEHFDAS